MQLKKINTYKATIELTSGLHVGGSSQQMQIGGIDNAVIKNPVNQQPYIPGSSIKGKMRSMLEWYHGLIGDAVEKESSNATIVNKLFGDRDVSSANGPTRLSFWDANLNEAWLAFMKEKDLPLTETKTENSIDRITGTAENPRQMERVPTTASFDFMLSERVHDDDDEKASKEAILTGLKLIELTGLGGSLSRGYGKFIIKNLSRNDIDISAEYNAHSINTTGE